MFHYLQPIKITSSLNSSNHQELFVDNSGLPKERLEKYLQLFDLPDPNSFVGWKVLEIDDIDAMKRIKTYADREAFYSKDFQARFNQVLKMDWWIIDGRIRKIPDRNYVKYLIQNPKTNEIKILEYPWAAYSPQTIKNYDDLISKYQSSTQSYNLNEKQDLQQEIKNFYANSIKLDSRIEIIYENKFYQLHQVGNIGIFVIPSFYITSNERKEYFNGIVDAFTKASKKPSPFEKLIIDLRGNDGGIDCAVCLQRNYQLHLGNSFSTVSCTISS